MTVACDRAPVDDLGVGSDDPLMCEGSLFPTGTLRLLLNLACDGFLEAGLLMGLATSVLLLARFKLSADVLPGACEILVVEAATRNLLGEVSLAALACCSGSCSALSTVARDTPSRLCSGIVLLMIPEFSLTFDSIWVAGVVESCLLFLEVD